MFVLTYIMNGNDIGMVELGGGGQSRRPRADDNNVDLFVDVAVVLSKDADSSYCRSGRSRRGLAHSVGQRKSARIGPSSLSGVTSPFGVRSARVKQMLSGC